MTKVICIDAHNCDKMLIEGQIYEVRSADTKRYIVKGVSNDWGGKWNHHYFKSRFIPLSSIDETEMIREKLDVIINEVKI